MAKVGNFKISLRKNERKENHGGTEVMEGDRENVLNSLLWR